MTLLNAELHINVSILKENICYLKTRIDKKSNFLAVVKANAYGIRSKSLSKNSMIALMVTH